MFFIILVALLLTAVVGTVIYQNYFKKESEVTPLPTSEIKARVCNAETNSEFVVNLVTDYYNNIDKTFIYKDLGVPNATFDFKDTNIILSKQYFVKNSNLEYIIVLKLNKLGNDILSASYLVKLKYDDNCNIVIDSITIIPGQDVEAFKNRINPDFVLSNCVVSNAEIGIPYLTNLLLNKLENRFLLYNEETSLLSFDPVNTQIIINPDFKIIDTKIPTEKIVEISFQLKNKITDEIILRRKISFKIISNAYCSNWFQDNNSALILETNGVITPPKFNMSEINCDNVFILIPDYILSNTYILSRDVPTKMGYKGDFTDVKVDIGVFKTTKNDDNNCTVSCRVSLFESSGQYKIYERDLVFVFIRVNDIWNVTSVQEYNPFESLNTTTIEMIPPRDPNSLRCNDPEVINSSIDYYISRKLPEYAGGDIPTAYKLGLDNTNSRIVKINQIDNDYCEYVFQLVKEDNINDIKMENRVRTKLYKYIIPNTNNQTWWTVDPSLSSTLETKTSNFSLPCEQDIDTTGNMRALLLPYLQENPKKVLSGQLLNVIELTVFTITKISTDRYSTEYEVSTNIIATDINNNQVVVSPNYIIIVLNELNSKCNWKILNVFVK